MNQIWTYKNFVVYGHGKEFVLHNKDKPFKEGHTHLHKLDQCKMVAHNVLKNKIPHVGNVYLLTSHAKISTNEIYIKTIENLIAKKKDKQKQKKRAGHI